MPRWLAIDGGQTECRAAVFEDEREVARAAGRPYAHHHGTSELEALLAGPMEAIDGLGDAARDIDAAALGLTGLHRGDELQLEMARRIAARTGARRVRMAGDVVPAHAGALGLGPGVVVTVGTGVMALATHPDGRAVTSGGRGYLLGDAGSGFDIGQAGLRAALRELDGVGGSAALWERAQARFGTYPALHRRGYGPEGAVPLVASFAEDVVAAAEAGDDIARGILDRAAGELAITTLGAVAALYAPGEAFALSWTGRLIRGTPLLSEPFAAAVSKARPEAEIVAPRGDGMEGARLLAAAPHDDIYPGLMGVYGA